MRYRNKVFKLKKFSNFTEGQTDSCIDRQTLEKLDWNGKAQLCLVVSSAKLKLACQIDSEWHH